MRTLKENPQGAILRSLKGRKMVSKIEGFDS